jgi:hypothetical protein
LSAGAVWGDKFWLSFTAGDGRMVFMKERGFFTDHYEVFLIVSNVALMAMVIFFMALSTRFQIGLLALSALILVFMLHSSRSQEPPCGAPIGIEGIARPRPGLELTKK